MFVILNALYYMFYIYMSCNSLEVCNLYIVCMYILISYSLSDSNNLEADRALLQYSPTTIAIRN